MGRVPLRRTPVKPKRLLLSLLMLLGAVRAQPPEVPANSNLPYFELQRDERPITVQQTATDAQGGIAVTRGGPTCRKDENISFFHAPDPRLIETKVNNTLIRSNAVLRSQPKEGGTEAQDRAVLDFFGGSLELDEETSCPKNVERNEAKRVVIIEGRTTISGSSLLYTNDDGKGNMKGPVDLDRRKEGDSPALKADAQRMDFNVDSDVTVLRGDVDVESDGRISKAEVLELDEEAGFAILRGNPATSRNDEGEVAGSVIEYDLDSNDVVVRGSVRGTFEIDVGDEETLPEVDTSFTPDEESTEASEIPESDEDFSNPEDDPLPGEEGDFPPGSEFPEEDTE